MLRPYILNEAREVARYARDTSTRLWKIAQKILSYRRGPSELGVLCTGILLTKYFHLRMHHVPHVVTTGVQFLRGLFRSQEGLWVGFLEDGGILRLLVRKRKELTGGCVKDAKE